MKETFPATETQDRQSHLPMTLIRSGGLPLSAWNTLAVGMPDWSAIQQQQENLYAAIYILLDTFLQTLPKGPLRNLVYNARKALFHQGSIPKALRKQFPVQGQEWKDLSDCLRDWDSLLLRKQRCEDDFGRALIAGNQALCQAAQNPVLQSGLLFASHDLRERLVDLAVKDPARWSQKDQKVAFAILKYYSRIVFKTSPLSVFTTLSVQPFVSDGRDGVGDWFESRTTVTPNVALLPYIYDVLLEDDSFRDSLQLRLNPSARFIASTCYEWLYFDGITEVFQQLPQQPSVEYLWEFMGGEDQKITFEQLSGVLEAVSGQDLEAVHRWLLRLIDMGFLEWNWPEKGLSPGWCGGLYQYLGFLPSSERCTKTAYLLQWLKTTARTLPFQEPRAVWQAQKEALVNIQSYFSQYNKKAPAITAEQIFYEDVIRETPCRYSREVLEQLIADLNDSWHTREQHILPEFRASLVGFARKELNMDENIPFLDFCKRFLASERGNNIRTVHASRYDGKMGAVVQPYVENGQYKAVVNGMYAGCGKMYARWWNQLAPQESECLKKWVRESVENVAAFPFPGWSNVHFQPALFRGSLDVPDGRLVQGFSGWNLPMVDLSVRLTSEGMPELWHPQHKLPVVLYDLGLEDPGQLPPVRKILWYLGVPYVTLDALLPEDFAWEDWRGIRRRRRTVFQSLTLAREAWLIPQNQWLPMSAGGATMGFRAAQHLLTLQSWGVPRYFFGKFIKDREKPQCFDMQSPVSVALFLNTLRKGRGDYLITEMLPLPEQCLTDRVQEYVLEWDAGVEKW